MKLGVNSVLFGGFDLETAFRSSAMCGYGGIELSAIDGMSEHLVLDRWQDIVPRIRALAEQHNLELLAIEQPSLDTDKMEAAFRAAAELGIPVINCGPGGTSGDDQSVQESIRCLRDLSRRAQGHGVTLCVKAHVGCAIHDTPTTQRALAEIGEPSFGLDFDPSHILRAGEDPVEALEAVVCRVRHVHIRDCAKDSQGPGKPEDQVPGQGDVDLRGLLQVLRQNAYEGPINLEIIGAKEYSLEQCSAIAQRSRLHLQAIT